MTRLLTVALSLGLAASVAQAEARTSIVPEGVAADAPPGYQAMCERDQDLCSNPVQPGTRRFVDAPDAMKLLGEVNRRVNRTVHWRADPFERWERPSGRRPVGDCEDFAIEKRAQLIDAGIPPEDLFYLIGYLPGVGLHAVLAAHTVDGDFILDNRTNALLAWGDGPYTWILRQAQGNPREWRNLLFADVRLASR